MKKLYVVCPANLKTGGPELLHQLVSVLNKLGVNAEIAYVNIVYGQHPTHTEYKQYVDEFVDFNDILDDRNNIIIFPESYTKQLYKFKNALKVIWWLSVDNAGSFKYRNKFRERFKRWLNALTGEKSEQNFFP